MHILALSRIRAPHSVLIFAGPVNSAAEISSFEPVAAVAAVPLLLTVAPVVAPIGVTSRDGGTDL